MDCGLRNERTMRRAKSIIGSRVVKVNDPVNRSQSCGAGGGRTLTMSPSTDFKSVASADSATAPGFSNFIPSPVSVKHTNAFLILVCDIFSGKAYIYI